ncbi:TPA: thioredoxin, partial [Streptococcus pyogenes]
MEHRLSMHYFQVKKEIFGVLLLSPVILLIMWGYVSSNQDDGRLTQKQYYETVVNQTVNLVFYKKSCPYCKVAKKEIATQAKDSQVITYYVDTSTGEGQKLVKKY